MKRFSEQLHKKSQTVKLRAAEKRELRERLVSYMEYHPLPANLKSNKVLNKKELIGEHTDAFKEWAIPFQAIFKFAGAAAAIVLVFIPFVAERAMPGDVLYAVKVQFNEEVRGTLTFDSFQKVEWETERLNRRIAEARLLASEGRLTAEAEAGVAEAVRVHSANAQREIEELRIEDADAATIASIALDTTLEVQSSSFKGDEEKDGVAGVEMAAKPVSLIASAIDESRSLSEAASASTTLPAYPKLVSRVEQNTTRIFELIQSLEEVVPTNNLNDVTRRNDDIQRALAEAIAVFPDDELLAREQLVEVLQRTEKLIIFINEIEVTNTIDIETLIPVVLTEDEMVQVRADSITSLVAKTETIEEQLVGFEDEGDMLEKITMGQAEITNLLARMSSSSVNFMQFRNYSAEAHAFADDILLMLEPSISEVVEIEPMEETATSTDEVIEETPGLGEIVEPVTSTSSEEIATSTPSESSAETAEEESELSPPAQPEVIE